MTSGTATQLDGTTAAQAQVSYAAKDYQITIKFTAPDRVTHPRLDSPKDWLLCMEFRCCDLLRIMKEGLYWTTSNVVPEGGWLGATAGSEAKIYPWKRVWELREFPELDESQCRWVAKAALYAHSWEPLADFRLHTLRRENVRSVEALNKIGGTVFLYNREPGDYNYNCFVDTLHPRFGSRWFWPMEEVLDYDLLNCEGMFQRNPKKEADTCT